MLPFFRKHIKILIWVIVLSFVVWGAGTIVTSKGSSSAYAGSIYGKKVSITDYQNTMRFYDILMRANAAKTSANADQENDGSKAKNTDKNAEQPSQPAVPSYDELRGLVWQTLILSQEAQKMGIKVSNEEVSEEIYRLFPSESGFNQKFYEYWVENQFRGRPRDFEETVRKNLAAEKVRQKVLEGVPDDKKQSKWMEFLINTMSHAKLKDYTSSPNQ